MTSKRHIWIVEIYCEASDNISAAWVPATYSHNFTRKHARADMNTRRNLNPSERYRVTKYVSE